MAALLALAGCEIPKEVNPVAIYRRVTGEADAGRERPPGLDQPWPNLGTVPPRPERPDARTREAISAGLEADRGRSREPLALRESRDPPPAETAPGTPPLPAAPPPRARLGQAAPIPWGTPGVVPGAAPAPRPGSGPAEPAPLPLPEPGMAPAAPPPDLLGPPPLPEPGMAPAAPPAELLAPSR